MLGLAQQVGRAHLGVGGVVGDDQDLGRAGEQIDADPAVELALGLGDIGVAGADQHVDRLEALGAERHRRHRLDAAQHMDSSAPPRCIAAIVSGCGPPWFGGVQAAMWSTPATLAVTIDMCAEATIG